MSRLKLEETTCYEKKLYRKIRKKLRATYAIFKQRSFRRRLKLLIACVCGIIRKKKPHMSCLGYGLPQKITAHSQEKKIKGFLENKWFAHDTFYVPFINEVLQDIFTIRRYQQQIKLVIDGSKMGNSHMALMISLWFEGRGIPLVWEVQKKPKGHFKASDHIALLHQANGLLHDHLSGQQQVIFMGDGEFDSPELQQACTSLGWDYVFRTSCNSVFYENGNRFQPRDLAVDKNHNFHFVADTEFTERRHKHVNFVLWHEEQYEEPLPLISNLHEPIDIIDSYQCRYSIEGMFKDMKSTTFNLHKTRLTKAQSIANLILVAAIALILTIKIGHKYQDSPLRPYINRVRNDKVVNTLISFGRDFIDYALDHGEKLNFFYIFSKNSP